MNYLLDALIVGIVIVTIAVYCKRGFVRDVIGFGKTLFSVIVAAAFGPWVGDRLAVGFLNDKLTDLIYETIKKITDGAGFSGLEEKLPEGLRRVAGQCGVDVSKIFSDVTEKTDLHATAARIAVPVSGVIAGIVGYAIVFAVAFVVFMIIGFILGKVVQLPVLHTFDKLLGFILGVICAAVFAIVFGYVARAVIYYFVLSKDSDALFEIIDNTKIFRYLCRSNI